MKALAGQQRLDFERLIGLGVCAFGITGVDWNGPHHCHLCAEKVDRDCAAFAADVAAGKFNARGYTPAEWKASAARRAAREGVAAS